MNINELFGVKEKSVLVTGGGTGIGRMIAEGFVANGAIVYIASRKDTTDVSQEISRNFNVRE